jgi:hypothetical protein
MERCEDLPKDGSCVLTDVSSKMFACLCLCEVSEGSDARVWNQSEDS